MLNKRHVINASKTKTVVKLSDQTLVIKRQPVEVTCESRGRLPQLTVSGACVPFTHFLTIWFSILKSLKISSKCS